MDTGTPDKRSPPRSPSDATRRRNIRRRSRSKSHIRSRSRSNLRSTAVDRSRNLSKTQERGRSRSPSGEKRQKKERARSPSYSSDSSASSSSKERKQKKKKKKKSKKKSKKYHPISIGYQDKRNNDVQMPGYKTDSSIVEKSEVKSVTSLNTETLSDARSFFSRLKDQESSKEAVGTVHARGFKPVSGTAVTDEWECVKRGCGNKNSKYAPACTKCGAMKRMSEWR
jgi:hypothetical protein